MEKEVKWEYHESTSESGDIDFWVSETGEISFTRPKKLQTFIVPNAAENLARVIMDFHIVPTIKL